MSSRASSTEMASGDDSRRMDRQFDLFSMRSVFCKQIPILVQRQGREDCVQQLSARLLLGYAPQQQSLFVVRMYIFSDADLLLLFSMEVTATDFQVLKAEQGILVDFLSFSDEIIKLLERCADCHEEATPSFQAVLGVGSVRTSLKVIETNDFNQVPHINLCFHQGTDASVKDFLAFRLKESTHRLEDVQAELYSATAELQSVRHERQQAVDRAAALESAHHSHVEQARDMLSTSEQRYRKGKIVQRDELLHAFSMCDIKVAWSCCPATGFDTVMLYPGRKPTFNNITRQTAMH